MGIPVGVGLWHCVGGAAARDKDWVLTPVLQMGAQSSHALYPHSGQAEHVELFAWDVAGHCYHLMKNSCSCEAEERARWGEEGRDLKWSCFGADGCGK